MSLTTAQQLIDQARVRHAAFFDVKMPDGALILFLNQRQRSLILQFGQEIEGLLTTSVQIAAVFNGLLVGSSGGVPVYGTTYTEGWPVKVDSFGVPYVNFSEISISSDPFGVNGGTPGFPLPAGFIKATALRAIRSDTSSVAVDVVSESDFNSRHDSRKPAAFVSGNRIVPMRDATTKSYDAWNGVTDVQLSYVGLKSITTLTQVVDLPDVLVESLVAGLAEMLAISSKDIPVSETQHFINERERAESILEDIGTAILGDLAQRHVQYRG